MFEIHRKGFLIDCSLKMELITVFKWFIYHFIMWAHDVNIHQQWFVCHVQDLYLGCHIHFLQWYPLHHKCHYLLVTPLFMLKKSLLYIFLSYELLLILQIVWKNTQLLLLLKSIFGLEFRYTEFNLYWGICKDVEKLPAQLRKE